MGSAVTVLGSVLAIGAVHVSVFTVVAAVAFATAATVAIYRRQDSPRLQPPTLILLALAVYTLAQALPLPMAWLRVLSPTAAQIWADNLAPFGRPPPAMATISLDPGGSMLEALKWITYAAVFAVASEIAARRGPRPAAVLLFLAACVAALATVAHGLFGLSRVWGIYEPKFTPARWNVGPLLNPNNLAGYLNLGSMAGIGLLLSRRTAGLRWAVALGVATLIGTSIVSASRGGTIALLAGASILWLAHRRDTGRHAAGRPLEWGVPAMVVGGSVLALLASTRTMWSELLSTNLGKLEMVRWTAPVLRDFPFFGIGRGASETVFAAYRQAPGHKIYTHVENFPAQWSIEWGLPVALAALFALGWHLRPGRLGVGANFLNTALAVGAGVLLLQNLVDLGLEVPAVVIALLTALGTAYGSAKSVTREREAEPSDERARRPIDPHRAIAFAAVALVAFAGTLRWGLRPASVDREAMRSTFMKIDVSKEDQRSRFFDALESAMSRHPADPYMPMLAGMVAWQSGEDAMPWLTQALRRDHFSSRAHLVAAYSLATRGAMKQALLHLRLAAESDSMIARHVAQTATKLTKDYNLLMLAVPKAAPGPEVLSWMGASVKPGEHDELRERLLAAATKADPDLALAHRLRGEGILLELGADPSRCAGSARPQCIDEVGQAISELARLSNEAEAAELKARLLLADDRAAEAAEFLSNACSALGQRVSCLRLRVEATSAAGSKDVKEASQTYLRAACRNADACARAATFVGDSLSRHGRRGLAVDYYRRATSEAPTLQRWMKLGNAASAAGLHAMAVSAYERAARLGKNRDSELRKRIQRERNAAVRSVLEVERKR